MTSTTSAVSNVVEIQAPAETAQAVPVIESKPAGLPWKIVFHDNPDTDAFACAWGAQKFVVSKNDDCTFVSVRAGESLAPEDCAGYRILTLDTGGGPLDQHGKKLDRASSFQLLAQEYKFANDPGIKPILELTLKADNVEKIDATSIHYVLRGLPHHFRNRKSGDIDWENCFTVAFAMFDILYGQAHQRHRSKKEFEKSGAKMVELPNGLKVINLVFRPELREAAYEAGADVVVWFSRPVDEKLCELWNGYYPAVQVHRARPLKLHRVMENIRRAEGIKRGVELRGRQKELGAVGKNPAFGAWFLHDSGRFIGCGTKSHELVKLVAVTDEFVAGAQKESAGTSEFTQLSRNRIFDIVVESLKSISAPPARTSAQE